MIVLHHPKFSVSYLHLTISLQVLNFSDIPKNKSSLSKPSLQWLKVLDISHYQGKRCVNDPCVLPVPKPRHLLMRGKGEKCFVLRLEAKANQTQIRVLNHKWTAVGIDNTINICNWQSKQCVKLLITESVLILIHCLINLYLTRIS